MTTSSLTILFGVLGNIMSGLVYISPANVFWRILKRRSTEEFESIPYISKLLNAFFWIYYGIIKTNGFLIVTVNVYGAIVEIIFLTIFLLFAPPKMKIRTAILVVVFNVIFPVAAIMYMQIFLHGNTRIDFAGSLCSVFSMIAYASPLSSMKTVILTKSVEYMPFLLSLILFLNSVVWTVYAYLLKDYFVGIPNVSGFVLGSIQLILYAMYWRPNSSSMQIEHPINDLEDPLITKPTNDQFFLNDHQSLDVV
ncbi:bidirectional sugar transporter SWEET16-like isoform X1 [Cannabis sativa]|uniref:bidirectional sugar transporter SWEET16-like isoform X1 n=1 Tax=Cannabis sativa TaxID=3483 RepID=UPI0011E03946|nr:bidirectional sugar transporter SWEET16-like isoform X1 [Cannabis sativa]